MVDKKLTLAIAALVFSSVMATQASANSSFTVENKSDQGMKLEIFRGDDHFCDIAQKTKKVSAGETASFSCEGGGENRCKVTVLRTGDDNRLCRNISSGCNNVAVRLSNNSTLIIPADHAGTECERVE